MRPTVSGSYRRTGRHLRRYRRPGIHRRDPHRHRPDRDVPDPHVHEVVVGLVWTIVVSIAIGVLMVGIVSAATGADGHEQNTAAPSAHAEEIIKGNLDIHASLPLKNPCYDMMHCDKTGCPAYGNDDHRCWYLVGTLCPSCAGGKYDAKIDKCRICDVYKSNAGDGGAAPRRSSSTSWPLPSRNASPS
ncbi:MAG: hypothetical protein MZU95_12505 [Desulfomicrobium escambiense]|nr:hypothetical protein [Desulfomicrobium escambiense]